MIASPSVTAPVALAAAGHPVLYCTILYCTVLDTMASEMDPFLCFPRVDRAAYILACACCGVQ